MSPMHATLHRPEEQRETRTDRRGRQELVALILLGVFIIIGVTFDAWTGISRTFTADGIAWPIDVDDVTGSAPVTVYGDPTLPREIRVTGSVTRLDGIASNPPAGLSIGLMISMIAAPLALISALGSLLILTKQFLRDRFFTRTNERVMKWGACSLGVWVIAANAGAILAGRIMADQYPGLPTWATISGTPSMLFCMLAFSMIGAILVAFRRARRIEAETEGLV